MKYIGEQLLPGQIGHFFVLLSFVASLLAMVAYFKATQATTPDQARNWIKLGRLAFYIDVSSVLIIFGILLYLVSAHRFEYYYAWEHSSKSLRMKFLLSCIWEGQEGSFLLWTIWQSVLGLVLIARAKKFEAPVMTVISFSQLCLATMIMGLYVGTHHIGTNPFLLVREFFQDAPIFSQPDYLSLAQMKDGQGLNQLLQNYWMVIHPPILFLGFASTVVPFAYAIAGLWKRDYSGWTKAAVPWALFSAAILGLGIMMGAAWAYESLTFGGYWAWDPVENASLVPWMIMVAGLHTLVIYNATGHSLRATYAFLILSFIFVLYSTFLTRSGILGDMSVHAFTDEGMLLQLTIFLFIFFIPSLVLFVVRFKQIPHIVKEENTWSREFWMFIGALVLFLSAMVITWQTSFNPLYNKISGKSTAVPEDPEFAYNKIQVFVAVVLGLLTAVTQYLRYRNTARKAFIKKITVPSLVAIALVIITAIAGGIHYDKKGPGFTVAIYLALFTALYAVVANATHIWSGLNGKFKAAGASIAHVGFGLMLVGIIISSSNKKVLSINTTGINLNFAPETKQDPMENLTLLQGVQTDMGKYWATYVNSDSTSVDGHTIYFQVNFKAKDSSEQFNLYPDWIKNTKGQQGFSNNPDKEHYWNRDIFSYISYTNRMERDADTATFRSYNVKVQDTIYYSNGFMILNKIDLNPSNDKYQFNANDTALMADITVVSKDNRIYKARPLFSMKNDKVDIRLDTVMAQNIAIGLTRVLPDKRVELQVKESTRMVPFLALKVYEFPQINILWIGTLVMVFGLLMSMRRRYLLNRSLR